MSGHEVLGEFRIDEEFHKILMEKEVRGFHRGYTEEGRTLGPSQTKEGVSQRDPNGTVN